LSFHEPTNACFGAVEAFLAQQTLNASAAIGEATLHEKQTNLLAQASIRFAPGAGCFVLVSVKTAATDLQRLTELLHRVALLSVHLFYEFEALEFSCPKMAKAFFKMSRWRLTVSNWRRNCATSAANSARPASKEEN
jgi:hypothetical protein